MKNVVIGSSILLLLFASVSLSQRELDRQEVLALFSELTSNPQKTWITQGTIEARHEQFKAAKSIDTSQINTKIKEEVQAYLGKENKRLKTDELQKKQLDAIPFNVRYKQSNEYSMVSIDKVIFDGERYCWETDIQSRQDSVLPSAALETNYMTDNFKMNFNSRNICIWDGQKLSRYSLPINNVMIDAKGTFPQSVNGSIKAGLIPWGYGMFSNESLISYESQAVENIVDGQLQISLSFSDSLDRLNTFVLDASKDYAIVSYVIKSNNSTVTRTYLQYQLVGEKWIPFEITIEKHDNSSERLLVHDLWEITNIDLSEPMESDFVLNYSPDAVVEYLTSLSSRNQIYQSSVVYNDEDVLADRLEYLANEGSIVQNCATASLGYTLKQLDIDVTASELSTIVDSNNMSSLLQLKEYAEKLGLYAKAVKLDIEALQDIEGSQVILHLPGVNHFVVLESIDPENAKLIDLSEDKFRYYKDTDFFELDWTEGTALLISANPIANNIQEIAPENLPLIKGGSGYSCTRLLQEADFIFCIQISGECVSNYTIYWERWGCEPAESGSCSTSWMYRRSESPCITDLENPIDCDITGNWTDQWIRACL